MHEWLALKNYCDANGLTPAEVQAVLEKYVLEKAAVK